MPTSLVCSLVGLVVALAAPLNAQSFPSDRPPDARRTGFGTAIVVAQGEVIVAWPHAAQFTPMMPPEIPGDVLVYRKDAGGTWSETARLRAEDGTPDNRFGRALAIDGGRMVMGATKQDNDLGAGYIFEKDAAGTWRQAARFQPADTVGLRNLGRAVGLAGDFVFVSTAAQDSGRGAVRVFKRDRQGRWTQHSALQPSDLVPNDFYGLSLAVEGTLLVVGAPIQDDRVGAAYVYRYDPASDVWREDGKLTVPGDSTPMQLGSAMSVLGRHVLVGAPGHDGGAGAVFVFSQDAERGAWSAVRTLRAFDAAPGSQFGSAIAGSGSEVWIGAPFSEQGEGRVYRYRIDAQTQEVTGTTKLAARGLDRRDFFGTSIAVSQSVAAVAIGNDDYGEGSVVIFEREADGSWAEARKVWTESPGMDPVVGGTVDCEGGRAVSFDCDQVDLLSFLPVQAIGGGRGVEVNDVWGWTDPETGREYALVGRYDGTAFVDVTAPANPVYLGELRLHEGAAGNVWRDIKVYRDHAFIVSDGAGPHGMQVFDLTQLRGVRTPPVQFQETAHYGGIGSAHNVVINEATGFAYAVGVNASGETCGGGLHMINIQDPRHPTFAGCFSDPATGYRRTGYSHDAMCIVYNGPDVEHRGREICFGANENALSIADVTDKSNPMALSSASYPSVAYAHQGWITEDHRYFFLDDEGDELQGTTDRTRTLIFDIADLDDPVMVKEHFGSTAASDHNLYIRGNLMYQSNYVAGLRVLDISDPENPTEVGYFDTVRGENRPGFAGSWSNYPFFESGTLLVTSGREGLFVLRKREALLP